MNKTPNLPSDWMTTLAATVTRARSLEELVRPLLDMLQAVTGLESTYLTTIDIGKGFQHILFSRNTHHMQIPEGLEVPWDGTLCKRALDDGRFYSDDVSNCWGDCEAARELGIATYASSPVSTDAGALYGTLCAASSVRMPINDNTESVLKLFAQLIGQQIDRERLVHELHAANSTLAASAMTDTVTRLPNRRALMQDMEQRLKLYRPDEYALVVAFIDLDKFKAINDLHGHETGDRFLEAVAGRLQSVLRGSDFAARLGGDEFVVLATTKRGDAEAAADALLDRLQHATTGRFRLEGKVLDYAGPSIGVTISAMDCVDAQSLITAADAKMYAVKRKRKEGEAQAHL